MAGQLWATATLGGYMYSDSLSDVLRMALQPLLKFRQFADIKDAAVQGKHKGDTFHWNVFSDVANQGTTLAETSTMPETNFTITQGTMTIGEFGNSVPFTEKLDDLSKQSVLDIIDKVLKNDAKKALDFAAYAQFNATQLRAIATGGTSTNSITLYTNGTVTGTNNVALGKEHVKVIVDTMKERNIPPYRGDDYICIAHPTTLRQLKNDLETIHQYVDQGFRMILNGEMGRYEGVRFIEQNNVAKMAFTNGKSNWAYFLGQDTVAEGIAIPEEMRGKIPVDYGRSRGVAWYYVGKDNCPFAAEAANDNFVNSGELLAA
ncbi:MAG: N4-gp56 family major capsid protein [Polyangiaceae bacterium]|jgi:N4-gp56 family major capsid protein|nr:N4-gp56 family major capsid protein [Polyangiaceae bacterium]